MKNFYSKYIVIVGVIVIGLKENDVFIGQRKHESMLDSKDAVIKFIQFLIDIYGMFDDYKEREITIWIYENFLENRFNENKKLIIEKTIEYGEAFTVEKVFKNTKESV